MEANQENFPKESVTGNKVVGPIHIDGQKVLFDTEVTLTPRIIEPKKIR